MISLPRHTLESWRRSGLLSQLAAFLFGLVYYSCCVQRRWVRRVPCGSTELQNNTVSLYPTEE